VSEEARGRAIGRGTELDGFVIEAVAGRGGMGVVYRARQKRPDRVVALKVIASNLAEDPQFRTRFQRESSIAAQIEHPNVIPVHAVGEADGVLYIAMRFVDGTDLRALLAREGRLEPLRAATIVDQVAQALDAAHAHGLVHRDVKPANILLQATAGREHVYLTDFGLTRHVDGSQGLTGTGAFLGTIDYVAPEQARGERVDARTDVYSLGCVLFQALTGTVPYPLENDLAKLYAHDSKPPPSVTMRAPEVPMTFEAVLARAMAKSPEHRYLSAGDLGRAGLAAAAGASLSRAERSVATGPAAPSGVEAVPAAAAVPSTPAPPTVLSPDGLPPSAPQPQQPPQPPQATVLRVRARPARRTIVGVAIVACAIAAVAIVLIASGGSSHPASSTSSSPLGAVQSQRVAAIPNLVAVRTKDLTVPQGYGYRLVVSKVQPPAGASPRTPVPYYFTLYARRGSQPLMTVERLKLPWPFTASSLIAQLQVDPNPDGSLNVGFSWFVRRGDTGDQTHYFTLTPQGINVNS
jgi:serine/threonine protein kinase